MPPTDEEVGMSNSARHVIGALIGLIITPLVAGALLYGAQKLGFGIRLSAYTGRAGGSDKWVGAALLILVAAVLGVSAGSRLSPLASLVPGVAFASVGVLWVLAPNWAAENTVRDFAPDRFTVGYMTLASYGGFLVIGVLLIVASLAPSRWTASTAGAAPRFGGPPPAPLGPPPGRPMSAPMGGQMAPPPPLGAPPGHAAPPPGAPGRPPQDQPWQSPSGPYGHPAHPAQPAPGAPGAPGSSPSPFAPPPAQSPKPSSPQGGSGEGVGEWTQMYGGDDLRGEGKDRS
ncbi:hypothetical protein [Actinomadura sp. NEAU-AAG7]|uniref:hypothetical protein n=1 Tax=Actinomadura sp. NEAU-AAG7 TaxID=2839640 RepID=UPI001BE3D05F|nr:hypothetical protein [Actinomadura sp. NEAU-AAG7]MBT2210647.1 hypothetical protein [Actinomadura sp. NEAU-AAG7]